MEIYIDPAVFMGLAVTILAILLGNQIVRRRWVPVTFLTVSLLCLVVVSVIEEYDPIWVILFNWIV